MDDAVIAGLPAHAGQDAFVKKTAAIDAKHIEGKSIAKREALSKNLNSAAKMAAIMATPDLSLAAKKPKSENKAEKKLAKLDAKQKKIDKAEKAEKMEKKEEKEASEVSDKLDNLEKKEKAAQ